ncbi:MULTISPECIES: hypothetical protein [Butyricimonas]|uniref:hypothetical protein n=1 Tax=Butyricimonas TaxID=574697 RepID=UPI001D0639EF|nr:MULTISPECIES: hypothetical protein [Butyricimonas]MCB6972539.1 hypothetical protein [Butyricimonas synergistica]MCG4519547.1 hypothetical protein [Butyricimonas sp. DFI.6.44]
MEKEYRLKDGGLIKASSPQEFVTRLREGSKFDSHLTDDEYMKAFAERFKIQTGKVIPLDTPEYFMIALIDFGYVMIV